MFVTKSTFSKNVQKITDFGCIFGCQNGEKTQTNSVEKHVFFGLGIFYVFFRIFANVARFWNLPGRPKIDKNSKKSCLGRFWNAFRFLYRFWNGFGKVLGRFGEVLGRVSEGFLRFFRSWRNLLEVFRVAGLALMIRATRGRSMDK